MLFTSNPELASLVCRNRAAVYRWSDPGDGSDAYGATTLSGDPTSPEAYRELVDASHGIMALFDAHDGSLDAAVVQAFRTTFEAAPILLVQSEEKGGSCDIAGAEGLIRTVRWPDILGRDLVVELRWLEARARLERLRAFVDGARVVPILVHDDPDPDALACALAVRVLLRRRAEDAPIVTLGDAVRPENRRMRELLAIDLTEVTAEEVASFERVVSADVQPVAIPAGPRLAVLDHHPPEDRYEAEFIDIRPDYGAAATLLTEYLCADDRLTIGERLATALLAGIKTDTAALSRGVSAADVEAYVYLHARADLRLLQLIERPSHSEELLRAFGQALAGLRVMDGIAVAYLGPLPPEETFILATLADLCMSLESVTWVAVGAVVAEELTITLRHFGEGEGAGRLARSLAGEEGNGGGHATMARVVLPWRTARRRFGGGDPADALLELVRGGLEELEVG